MQIGFSFTGVSTAKFMSELSWLDHAWQRALRARLPPPGALFSLPRRLPVLYPESWKRLLVPARLLSRSVSCLMISVRASRRLGVAGKVVAAPLRRSSSASAFLNGVGVRGVVPSEKSNKFYQFHFRIDKNWEFKNKSRPSKFRRKSEGCGVDRGPGLRLGVLALGHDDSGLRLLKNCDGLNGSCLMGVDGVVSSWFWFASK